MTLLGLCEHGVNGNFDCEHMWTRGFKPFDLRYARVYKSQTDPTCFGLSARAQLRLQQFSMRSSAVKKIDRGWCVIPCIRLAVMRWRNRLALHWHSDARASRTASPQYPVCHNWILLEGCRMICSAEFRHTNPNIWVWIYSCLMVVKGCQILQRVAIRLAKDVASQRIAKRSCMAMPHESARRNMSVFHHVALEMLLQPK